MHIVFVSTHCDPRADLGEPDAGGQCVYQDQLAHALAKEGARVTTFCRQTGIRPDHETVTDGYDIHRIETGKREFVPKEILEAHMPQFVRGMHDQLKKSKDQDEMVLHGHYWDGAKSALMYKHNYQNTPFIWTPHSLGTAKRKKFPGQQYENEYKFLPRVVWENYGIYAADNIIVSTANEKQQVLDQYSVVKSSAAIIPPGIDLSAFEDFDQHQMRDKYQIPQQKLVMLCLGRLSRSKGYHHAIQVLRKLKDMGHDAHLVIVGGSADPTEVEEKQYRRELHELAQQLGMTQHVQFKPAVSHDQVGELYAAANVFMMTSENEPYGLTTIEAMASGTPVFAHKIGGTKDIIEPGETGVLVDMHKYQAVAQQLADHYQSKKLEQIGTAARDHIHKHFSWQSRAQRFLEVYEAALNKNSKRLEKMVETNYFLQHNLQIQKG